EGVNLGRRRQTRVLTLGAVKNGLKIGKSLSVNLSRVDLHLRRRSVGDTSDRTDRCRGSRNLPAERRRLRRVVDRGTSLLRRSRRSTIDQVQLVAVGVTLNVVSEQRTVSEAERLARLLTELKARKDRKSVVEGRMV